MAKIQKGLNKGVTYHPHYLYIKEALRNRRKESIGGIKINGMSVQTSRIADDIELITNRKKMLQKTIKG